MSIDPFSLDSYDYDLPEERIAQYLSLIHISRPMITLRE